MLLKLIDKKIRNIERLIKKQSINQTYYCYLLYITWFELELFKLDHYRENLNVLPEKGN